MIYLDSSVALAHLLLEPRSPPESFWDSPLISSRLLQYEVWNRVHAYGLANSHRDLAAILIGRLELVDLAPSVLARALEAFPLPIKTLDALHLATVEHLRGRGEPIALASYDHRLLAAARALGIAVATL